MKHINVKKVTKTIGIAGGFAAAGTVIGFIAGYKFWEAIFDIALCLLGRKGETIPVIVDGVEYVCQVVPKTKTD